MNSAGYISKGDQFLGTRVSLADLKLKTRIIHKGLILISVPVLLSLFLIFQLSNLLYQAKQEIDHELRLKEAMALSDQLTRTQLVARSSAISFNASGDYMFKSLYETKLGQIVGIFENLKKLLSAESDMHPYLEAINKDIADRAVKDKYLLDCMMPSDLEELKRRYREQLELVSNKSSKSGFIASTSLFEKLQSSASRANRSVSNTVSKIRMILFLGVLLSFMVSLLSALYFSRNISFRLLNILANTERLPENLPLNKPMKGSDEIAELDQLLYDTVTEIREHERFHQTLIGIVSHEIKTPLSAVSGILSALSHGIFGAMNSKGKELIEQAERDLGHLMQMLTEFLKPERRDGNFFEREYCLRQLQTSDSNQPSNSPAPDVHISPAKNFDKQAVPEEQKQSGLRLRIWHKGMILVAVPLIFELLFVTVLSLLLYETAKIVQSEERSQDIISTANQVMNKLVDADIEVGSYLVSEAPEHLRKWQQIKDEARRSLDHLKTLTLHDPVQSNNAEQFGSFLFSSFAGCQRAVDNPNKQLEKMWKEASRSKNTKKYVSEAQLPIDNLLSLETINGQRQAQRRELMSRRIRTTLLIGIILNILLSTALTIILIHDISRRLYHVMANTRHLLKKEQLDAPLRGSDEIAYLDRFFYQTAQQLRNLETRKKELIHLIGDELKLPLASIQNTVKLVLSEELGELSSRAESRLHSADRELDRLMRLINDLLNFNKMEAGKFDLLIAELPLSEVLQTATAAVAQLAELYKVNLEAQEDCPVVLSADRDRLTQVLINLLSNAIKFSTPGATVKLISKTRHSMLEISIIDQGRGIPAELQEKIFDRYFQVKEDDATLKGGSGLGLAIVKSIVEQHGGTITVNSKEGKGSTFCVSLPLKTEALS